MATRFYLHASGSIAPANNPAFDAGWEQTGQAVRLPMDVKAQQGPQTALTNSTNITVPITTTQQILCYQFTSNQIFPPINLGTDCTFSMVLRGLESATTANVFLAYVLRAYSVNGLTSLGTLASSMTNAGTEFVATAATRIFSAIALTALTITQPWRLVIDVGGHAQGPTAGTTYTYRVGTNATSDFALTSALTTDLNPWFELSYDLPKNSFEDFRSVKSVSTGIMSVGEVARNFGAIN